MKKVLILAIAILVSFVSVTMARASNMLTCYYPQSCEKITSTEYSTGGGDSIVQYLELDCINSNLEYVKYTYSMGSLAGSFGLGRLTIPKKIIFKKHPSDTLECR